MLLSPGKGEGAFFARKSMTNTMVPSQPNSDHTSKKVLNVEVPEVVYWHIRKCATESRMSMKEFMSVFCTTATPIPFDVDAEDNESKNSGPEATEVPYPTN